MEKLVAFAIRRFPTLKIIYNLTETEFLTVMADLKPCCQYLLGVLSAITYAERKIHFQREPED